MKVKKKFYVVEAHGGKYIVPDRKVEKITSSTLIIKDQLCQFLNANISPEASKITVLSVASVLGEAIKRIHKESSVSSLFV